jgi:hypothetical protein
MDDNKKQLNKLRIEILRFKQVLKDKKEKIDKCKCKNNGDCIKELENKIYELELKYNEIKILSDK